ncbi:MAG: hypothetical protein ABW146_08550 [Candidatus Sedimenticola sp. 6PFRAG7]
MTESVTECIACGKEVSRSARTCPHCGQKRPGVSGKDKANGCLVIITVGLLIGLFTWLSSDSDPSSTSTADQSIEYKLATINADGMVNENDVTVNRFRYLLKSISERTGDTPERIADLTVFTQNKLRDEFGKEIGLLELMEGGNKALSGNNVSVTYKEIMAMMIVMLSQQ